MVRLAISNIVTAFGPMTVGTKVINEGDFFRAARLAIEKHDFSTGDEPGQAVLTTPELIPFVCGGVARRSNDPFDYVVRTYRESVQLFMRRSMAAPVESVSLVVHTAEAYLADPETMENAEETKNIKLSAATHVLVAIPSSAGPKAPWTIDRFVRNLAGGNNEAKGWSAEYIRSLAKEVVAYHDDWCVVSD